LNSRVARQGIAFVLSAPSGTGKTTLAVEILERVQSLTRTISCTTRSPRQGERDGVDYTFVDQNRFFEARDAGEFLEWARVHDNYYGTPRSEIERIHGVGSDALMVIDVQGGEQVRERLEDAVMIFVLPPSPEALRQRLEGRDGADSVARSTVNLRLRNATEEISRFLGYDYLVINDSLAEAVEELQAIVVAERCRRTCRQEMGQDILDSFRASLGDSI
jgi:guanylate kinase